MLPFDHSPVSILLDKPLDSVDGRFHWSFMRLSIQNPPTLLSVPLGLMEHETPSVHAPISLTFGVCRISGRCSAWHGFAYDIPCRTFYGEGRFFAHLLLVPMLAHAHDNV